MKNRLLVAGATAFALVAGGFGAIAVAAPAPAHTPTLSATCATGATINATNYNPAETNRWTIKVNGKITGGVFGASTSQTVAFPQGGTTSTYTLTVDAPGTQYDARLSGSVGPCGSLPRDADATVSVTPPTCDLPGTATFNLVNAITEGTPGSNDVGTHSYAFYPTRGHLFTDGTTIKYLTYTILPATGYQSTNPAGACYQAPPKKPVVGTASITVTAPTCDVPTNGLTVVVPEGLTVNGFTAGTYTAEDIAKQAGLTDIYHEWTVPVVVADGYSYDGPPTLTFTLTDPATLDCSGPQPDDKIVVSDWVDQTGTNCDVDYVLQTRTVTTTPYVKVDGKWVLDEEHVTSKTEEGQRPKTAEEIEDCAVVTPPTDEPTPPTEEPTPPTDTPTDEPSTPTDTPTTTPTPNNTIQPAAVQHAGQTPAPAPVKATPKADTQATLAYTGATISPWTWLFIALALALGIALLVFGPIRNHYSRRSE
jgi:hypothetical protein